MMVSSPFTGNYRPVGRTRLCSLSAFFGLRVADSGRAGLAHPLLFQRLVCLRFLDRGTVFRAWQLSHLLLVSAGFTWAKHPPVKRPAGLGDPRVRRVRVPVKGCANAG